MLLKMQWMRRDISSRVCMREATLGGLLMLYEPICSPTLRETYVVFRQHKMLFACMLCEVFSKWQLISDPRFNGLWTEADERKACG